jgi:hypothetical protein
MGSPLIYGLNVSAGRQAGRHISNLGLRSGGEVYEGGDVDERTYHIGS